MSVDVRRRARRHCEGRGPHLGQRDRGAVTVEFALALPAVVAVVGVLLVTLAVGGVQLRALDAARTAARVAALGLDDAQVVEAAHRVLPGADVTIRHTPPWVTVEVRAQVSGAWLSPTFGLRAQAAAWVE